MNKNIVNLRPLNKVMSMVEEINHRVTYAFDDLVFIEHSEIILKFNDQPANSVSLFIHEDICHRDKIKIKDAFLGKAKAFDLEMKFEGTFSILEHAGEEKIDVKFNGISVG